MTKQEAKQKIEKILDALELDEARDLVSDLDDYIGEREGKESADEVTDDDDDDDDDDV
jgi:hypothetical protein